MLNIHKKHKKHTLNKLSTNQHIKLRTRVTTTSLALIERPLLVTSQGERREEGGRRSQKRCRSREGG